MRYQHCVFPLLIIALLRVAFRGGGWCTGPSYRPTYRMMALWRSAPDLSHRQATLGPVLVYLVHSWLTSGLLMACLRLRSSKQEGIGYPCGVWAKMRLAGTVLLSGKGGELLHGVGLSGAFADHAVYSDIRVGGLWFWSRSSQWLFSGDGGSNRVSFQDGLTPAFSFAKIFVFVISIWRKYGNRAF